MSKGLTVNRSTKENRFKGVWDELEAKKLFEDTIIHKIFETNSSFHVKQRITGKV